MRGESAVIRALSWNVHGFVGRSGKRDHHAVMSAVRSLDADVVALQEIDERSRESSDEATFITLREAFSRHSAEARTIRSPDGDYGHVLMSRWPMHDTHRIDLTVSGREPRMALSSRVDTPDGEIRVLAAHLGLSARERQRQLATIARHLQSADSAAAIVLGDFNEWRRKGPATRTLCPPFLPAARRPTFPSRRPIFALDRIWCRPPLEALRSRVAVEHCDLSDHLPIMAELRFTSAQDTCHEHSRQ